MRDAKVGEIVKVLRDNRLWVVLEVASPYVRIQALPAGEIRSVKRDEYSVQDLDQLLGRYHKMLPKLTTQYFAHSLPKRNYERMKTLGKVVRRLRNDKP